MVKKNIAIKTSKIHGNGVFAEKDISKGEVILDWRGSVQPLNRDQLESLPKSERKCVSFIDDKYILMKGPARFVNHSCKPNARGADGQDIAIRRIKRGEEITVDYVAEKVPDLNLKCNCAASNCRGIL